jgi:hypothetical protein
MIFVYFLLALATIFVLWCLSQRQPKIQHHSSPFMQYHQLPPPPQYPIGSSSSSSSVEPKYTMSNGIMCLNPRWVDPTHHHGSAAPTTASSQFQAIVTNPDDVVARNDAMTRAGMAPTPMAPSFGATVAILQDPAVAQKAGQTPGNIIDNLCAVFKRLEAPIGLTNKLMVLMAFDELEFIVDDSGSMDKMSNQTQTRFEEARCRLLELFDILAVVPKPAVRVHFLNRRDNIVLQQQAAEQPAAFVQRAKVAIDAAFSMPPGGTTPILEKLITSFAAGAGRKVFRYLLCDGVPDGGRSAIDQICALVCGRQAPASNPITFMSCSNVDEEVEWMKELESVATYAAEYDDYRTEAREVSDNQGLVLPFTHGFYVIGTLVAAMYPEDLDAMDESVPLTKFSYDNILGVTTTPQEYRHYWDGFMAAQRKKAQKPGASALDRFEASFRWDDALLAEFSRAQLSTQIARVVEYKQQLQRIFESEHR